MNCLALVLQFIWLNGLILSKEIIPIDLFFYQKQLDQFIIESLGQITEVETGDSWDSNKLKEEKDTIRNRQRES